MTILTEDWAGRETCATPCRKMDTEAVMRLPATRASGGARSNVHIWMSATATATQTVRVRVTQQTTSCVRLSDGNYRQQWHFTIAIVRRSLQSPRRTACSVRRLRLTRISGTTSVPPIPRCLATLSRRLARSLRRTPSTSGSRGSSSANNAKSPFPEPVGICTNRRNLNQPAGTRGATLTGWCFYTSRRGLH